MRRLAFTLLLVFLGLVALLFGALNQDRVSLELAFVRLYPSVGFALVVAFVLGLLLGVLWRLRWVAQLLTERGRLRRALRLAEAQARTAADQARVS